MKRSRLVIVMVVAVLAVFMMAVPVSAGVSSQVDGVFIDSDYQCHYSLIAGGYDPRNVESITFTFTVDDSEGFGGGIMISSDMNGWDQRIDEWAWGDPYSGKPITAVGGGGLYTLTFNLKGYWDEFDGELTYANVAVQQWWGRDITITGVSLTVVDNTVIINAAPIASAITYGQTLNDSTLSGGAASVPGSFAWKDDTISPAVSDSDTTEYDVVFTPEDTDKYTAAECKVTVTVNKADASVSTAPEGKDLAWSGNAQALVTEGTADGGTMNYAIGTDDKTAPTDGWSAGVPEAADPDTYYVWYKAVGDENHNDSEAACVTSAITAKLISDEVIFKVENGSWDDKTTEDKSVTLSRYENEDLALVLKPEDIPAVGNEPSGGYMAGKWDVTPSTETAISEDTTFTYTFDAASSTGGKQDIDLSVVVCYEVYGDEIQCIVSASVDGEYELTVADKQTTIKQTTITVKDHLGYFNAGAMDAGSYQATISFDGDSNYNPASNTTTFEVFREGTTFEVSAEPAQVVEGGTIRIVPTLPDGASGTVKYFLGFSDDKLLGEKPVGEDLELPTSGEDALAPGTYAITAEYSGDANYAPAKEIVLVTIIAKPSLTITALPQTFNYNGTTQGEGGTVYKDPAEIAEKVSFEGLCDGDSIASVELDGQGMNVGDYEITVSSASIVNASGDPVTDDYNITFVPGKLTISKGTPSIKTVPAASAITYGQTLSDSTLSGGEASVPGTFAWKDDTKAPAVSDSGKTEYDVVFTPDNTDNYETAECKVTVAVNKADADVTTPPTGKDLAWSGTAQALVSAGTAEGGEMQYVLGTDDKTAPENGWSTAVPEEADPGTYYIWYKAVGDENHNDSEAACVTSNITAKLISYTVTFKVENGAWNDKTAKDKSVTLSRYENEDLALVLKPEDIPAVGNEPSGGYMAGKWDVTPSTETEIKDNPTYTYTYAQKPVYKVIEGANGKVQKGSGNGLNFKTDGDYGKFTGIKIDSTEVISSMYDSKSGSTIVTLKSSLIDKLEAGNHSIEFLYTDGSCGTEFEVQAAAAPTKTPTPSPTNTPAPVKPGETAVNTGDPNSMGSWMALITVSVLGIGIALFARRKSKR